mmetsp:Transcript_13488/g.22966  ORF Transcript_13488/g.22966 Transcript_13488/m.22966 type:complete len:154 (+) Transcript_13488:559-1020(+)
MDEKEVHNLLEDAKLDGSLLQSMLVCEPEIEKIQSRVNKHINEVEQLARQNVETKSDLKKLTSEFEDKVSHLAEVQARSLELEKEAEQKLVSKKHVCELLQQRVREKEVACKELEKKLVKEKELGLKEFVESFMRERVQFHTQQIYKVKVASS